MLKVTATNLPRLLVCNGSRLLDKIPSSNEDDTARKQGNAADWLVGQVFNKHFTVEELVNRKAENGVYITEEMVENLSDYLSWIDGKGSIEHVCDYQGNGWYVAGRADHIYFDRMTSTLHISDLKYGWKVVDVVKNYTLISHAVGWCLANNTMPYNFEFHIYQPRAFHPEGPIRSWSLSQEDFKHEMDYIFETLGNLKDEVQTSKHCYKCPSWTMCPAAQIKKMTAIEESYQAYNSDPDNDTVEKLIEETKNAIDSLKQSLTAYEDLAIHRLRNGSIFKNYMLQTTVGRETWRDDITPEFIEMITGVDVSKKTIITPSQAIKAGVPKDFISSVTHRPSGGLKLTKTSSNELASKLFNKPTS